MVGGRVDPNGGVPNPLFQDNKGTRRWFAVNGVKPWAWPLSGKLTPGSQKKLWKAVGEDIASCFPQNEDHQTMFLAAAIRRREAIVAAKESMTRLKNHREAPRKQAFGEEMADRGLELMGIREHNFRVGDLVKQIRTKRDFNAVKTVLTDSSERREAMIDAACRELDLAMELQLREPDADIVGAMERGLEVAFPLLNLTDEEVDKKIAEVMETDDVANGLFFAPADAFRNLLKRDWILENAADLFYRERADGNPWHVSGNPLVVKPLIVEEVFKALNEKIKQLRSQGSALETVTPKQAGDDRMTKEHRMLLEADVLGKPEVRKEIARRVNEKLDELEMREAPPLPEPYVRPRLPSF